MLAGVIEDDGEGSSGRVFFMFRGHSDRHERGDLRVLEQIRHEAAATAVAGMKWQ